MNEIDLIPKSYRKWLLHLHLVKYFTLGAMILVMVSCLSYVYLMYLSNGLEGDIDKLQRDKIISAQQRDELVKINADKNIYQRQLSLLGNLRSGAAAERMFVVIDQAISGEDVWFRSWKLWRKGYSLGQNNNPSVANEDWQVETQISIKGNSGDYISLSSFVKALLEQSEISDVRVLDTALRRYTRSNVIDFDLLIDVSRRGNES